MYQEPKATADELFRIIMIDRKRKVKMAIQLRDKDGDEIPIRETIEKLTEYIGDKLKAEGGNICKQQIMPLMSQAVVGGMIKLMGQGPATFMLSNEHTRYGLINMMTVAFYLVKWIQGKNLKIHTIEESITQEDVDMYDRISTASDISVQSAAMGNDPKMVIREMVKRGQLKKSDLKKMGTESWLDEETSEEEKKGAN